MFKRVLIVSIFMVLVVASLLVLAITVTPIRDRVLLAGLEPYGVQHIATDIQNWSVDGVLFESVHFNVIHDGMMIDALLTDIEVSRQPGDWLILKNWSVKAAKVTLDIQVSGRSDTHVAEKEFVPHEFLPESLLGKIPVGLVQIDALNLAYRLQGKQPWLVTGDMKANAQQLNAAISVDHQAQRVSGQIKLTPKQIDLNIGKPNVHWLKLQTKLDYVDTRFVAGGVFQMQDLTGMEDWLALIFHQLSIDVPVTDGWGGRVDGAFSLNVPASSVKDWLNGANRDLQDVSFTGQVNSALTIQSAAYDLSDIQYRGSASIQFKGNKLDVLPWVIEHGSARLPRHHGLVEPWAELLVGDTEQVEFVIKGNGKLLHAIETNQVMLGITEGALQVNSLANEPESTISLRDTSLTLEEGRLKVISGLSPFNIALLDKPNLKGIAKYQVDGKTDFYKGKLDVVFETLPQIKLTFDYLMESDRLDFNVNSEKTSLAAEAFNDWAASLSLPIELQFGDMAMAMQGSVDLNKFKGFSATGELKMLGWQGELENNHFSSLDGSFEFSGNLSDFVINTEVTNGLFDVGLPITDIHYNLTFIGDFLKNRYRIEIDNLESKLVGGLVRIPELVWDSDTQSTEFNVVIIDWQLSEIIDLLQRDDLKVTGVLDGMLPVSVNERGVSIKNGLLTARAPGGVIHYLPDESMKAYLSDQEQLKLAVDVLENFEYEQLDVTLNQDVDYSQLLNLTLKGKNPELMQGHPVVLNLNVEHNIEPLLQSLTIPGYVQKRFGSNL